MGTRASVAARSGRDEQARRGDLGIVQPVLGDERAPVPAVEGALILVEQRQRRRHGDALDSDLGGGKRKEAMDVVTAKDVEAEHARPLGVEDQVDGLPEPNAAQPNRPPQQLTCQ